MRGGERERAPNSNIELTLEFGVDSTARKPNQRKRQRTELSTLKKSVRHGS